MATLKELQNSEVREKFVNDVVSFASKIKDKSVELNKGIRNTAELIERSKIGITMSFDFDRLIEDSF